MNRQAGDAVDDFISAFIVFEMNDLPANAKNLMGMGELKIIVEIGAGPYLAYFNAAMSFIDGLAVRGEKRRGREPRYQI